MYGLPEQLHRSCLVAGHRGGGEQARQRERWQEQGELVMSVDGKFFSEGMKRISASFV